MSADLDVTALARGLKKLERCNDSTDISVEEARALLAELGRLQEEIRVREESQIPVIPRAAQERLERLQQERDDLVALIDEADFYPDAVSAELALRKAERERDAALEEWRRLASRYNATNQRMAAYVVLLAETWRDEMVAEGSDPADAEEHVRESLPPGVLHGAALVVADSPKERSCAEALRATGLGMTDGPEEARLTSRATTETEAQT